MLGFTRYFLRLRAAGVALMPSVAVALGLMGVAGATADDGARNPGSRTGTVLRYRVDAAQVRLALAAIHTDGCAARSEGRKNRSSGRGRW